MSYAHVLIMFIILCYCPVRSENKLTQLINSLFSESLLKPINASVLTSTNSGTIEPFPESDDWTTIDYRESEWPGFYELKSTTGSSYIVLARHLAVYCRHSNGFALEEVSAYGFRKSLFNPFHSQCFQ